MPPAIHPVDLVQVLRHKKLTPAIVFLTSRRACDEAINNFQYRHEPIPTKRSAAIKSVLDRIISEYPSITHHPMIPTVQQYGVAAHHAGHLPSWKIAIEELMRKGCLDAVFATTTLAAGVDFPARTVVITQSSVRKARDFMDLSVSEIQQLAGRGGRRGKDYVGFVVITPSPYIDINHIAKGLTGNPEPIDSQFFISYPMVLNLLKAHTIAHIHPILEKSFAQFQLSKRADNFSTKLETITQQLDSYGLRECTDWITQWQSFDLAKKQRRRHIQVRNEPPEVVARLPFLTPGRVVALSKDKAIILRQYRSRGQSHAMLTVLRSRGRIIEYPAGCITKVFDQVIPISQTSRFPWCTSRNLDILLEELDNLPTSPRYLPIRIENKIDENQMLTETLDDEFPCPTCSSRNNCRKDHPQALKLRQESHRLTKTIHTLRTELWHQFQQHVDVLKKFGYLTGTCHLTANGDWARLIRINHSLLITELIRMDAFNGIEPSLLTAVLASIAHDDDRPGAFPRKSPALATILWKVRSVAKSLNAYEKPPLLRSDIAAIAEMWVGQPTLPWSDLIQATTMDEGDIYRLLSRALEYLSQIYGLRATHPSLANIADQAMNIMRRDVLEELP